MPPFPLLRFLACFHWAFYNGPYLQQPQPHPPSSSFATYGPFCSHLRPSDMNRPLLLWRPSSPFIRYLSCLFGWCFLSMYTFQHLQNKPICYHLVLFCLTFMLSRAAHDSDFVREPRRFCRRGSTTNRQRCLLPRLRFFRLFDERVSIWTTGSWSDDHFCVLNNWRGRRTG